MRNREDESLLAGRIRDLARQAEQNGYVTHTGFLSLSEQSLALSVLAGPDIPQSGKRAVFFGGTQEADRKVLFFPITPDSLEPYPAPWITPEVYKRIFLTSLLRAIGCSEHKAYWHVFTRARSDAKAWAERTKDSYLAFQTYWSGMMAALWRNEPLARAILDSGTPRAPVPRKKRSRNMALEGVPDGLGQGER